MSKAKFEAARELISEKKYDEARAILKTIDHSKAREWEDRLDRIAPTNIDVEFPEEAEKVAKKVAKKKPAKRYLGLTGTYWLIIGVFCVIVILIAQESEPTEEEQQATQTVQAVAANATASIIALMPPTATPIPSATPTITDTPLPSATPTITDTPIPSATPTITDTPIPSATPTITNTPLPSNTPLPTPTQSPQEQATNIVSQIIRPREIDTLFVLNDSVDSVVTVRYPLPFSGTSLDFAEEEMIELLCALRNGGFGGFRLRLFGVIMIVDSFGTVSEANGLGVVIESQTASRINCENQFNVNLSTIADTYDLHPAMRN